MCLYAWYNCMPAVYIICAYCAAVSSVYNMCILRSRIKETGHQPKEIAGAREKEGGLCVFFILPGTPFSFDPSTSSRCSALLRKTFLLPVDVQPVFYIVVFLNHGVEKNKL